MKADVAKVIENIHVSCSFESYCFNVLSKYEAGRKLSLTSHLENNFSHMAVGSLADHNYPDANQSVNTDTVDIPSSKTGNVKKSIKNVLESKIKNYLNHPNQQISYH